MVSGRKNFRLYSETRRGVQASLRNNSAAFGYSIVVTCVFSMLHSQATEKGLGEIYLFIIGAVAAFGVMEVVASHGFRDRLQGEPSDVIALGSTFSILSIGTAVGVSAGVVRMLSGQWAWGIAAFTSTLVYLVLVGVELAVAQRIQEARDDRQKGGEEGAEAD